MSASLSGLYLHRRSRTAAADHAAELVDALGTHTVLPLPDRDLLVVADEAVATDYNAGLTVAEFTA